MCGTIDTLAAKVPTVKGKLFTALRVGNLDGLNLNAVGGVVLLLGIVKQSIQQAAFAHFAFTDENEFGFVESYRINFSTKVGFNGSKSLGTGGVKFWVERVASNCQPF
ncbi:hypothetical protein GMJAKD_13075 [Candidatus Electrothrix aarhusensis]